MKRLLSVVLVAFASQSFPTFGGEIHDAAMQGNLTKVKQLLEKNPELLNEKLDGHRTPLFLAACEGRKDVVEFLLSQKADTNAKDKFGATPIFCAVSSGNKDVLKLLIQKGADLSVKMNDGTTPIGLARDFRDKEMIEILLNPPKAEDKIANKVIKEKP